MKPRNQPRGLVGPDGSTLAQVARPLVRAPSAAGVAEHGMQRAVSLRMAQLVTLARESLRERQLERIVANPTEANREPGVYSGPADLRDQGDVLFAGGAALAAALLDSIVTYAREYDADDNDDAVTRDAAIFLDGLASTLQGSRLLASWSKARRR